MAFKLLIASRLSSVCRALGWKFKRRWFDRWAELTFLREE